MGIVGKYFQVVTGTHNNGVGVVPSATIDVVIDNERFRAIADGIGPVDALYKAVNKAISWVDKEPYLVDYQVQSRQIGPDAVVDVRTKISIGGASYEGVGIKPDVVEASFDAYVDAINSAMSHVEIIKRRA